MGWDKAAEAAPALPAELVDALRGLLARHGGSTAQVSVTLHLRGQQVSCVIEEPRAIGDVRGRFSWRLLLKLVTT